jgi:glycosyltransferase involved in cell wall biosynthesis
VNESTESYYRTIKRLIKGFMIPKDVNTHSHNDPNGIEVTAVIPAYNEQKTIGSIVLGAKQHAERVIVVDDGSQDSTGQIAKLAGAQIIHHTQNQGKGAALETGLQAAEDADIVVTLDSDGQHHPQEIPQILEPIVQGRADFVNGSRYLTPKNSNRKKFGETPFYRRVGQNVLDSATNLNSKLKVTDSQSGFRAFKGNTLDKFSFHSNGYSIESEMLIEAAHAGLKIEEVPIKVSYGEKHHHKKNPLSHGFNVLMRLLHEMEFNRPLYYFTLPGIIMIIIGLILGLNYFSKYLAGITDAIFPTALAVLITILGAFIAFTGVLLHTMSRMIKNRRKKTRSLYPNPKHKKRLIER